MVFFLDLGIKTARLDLHHALADVRAVWYTVWHEGNCQISDGLAESSSCRTDRMSLCCTLVVTAINVNVLNWGWLHLESLAEPFLCLSATLVTFQLALLNDNCSNISYLFDLYAVFKSEDHWEMKERPVCEHKLNAHCCHLMSEMLIMVRCCCFSFGSRRVCWYSALKEEVN